MGMAKPVVTPTEPPDWSPDEGVAAKQEEQEEDGAKEGKEKAKSSEAAEKDEEKKRAGLSEDDLRARGLEEPAEKKDKNILPPPGLKINMNDPATNFNDFRVKLDLNKSADVPAGAKPTVEQRDIVMAELAATTLSVYGADDNGDLRVALPKKFVPWSPKFDAVLRNAVFSETKCNPSFRNRPQWPGDWGVGKVLVLCGPRDNLVDAVELTLALMWESAIERWNRPEDSDDEYHDSKDKSKATPDRAAFGKKKEAEWYEKKNQWRQSSWADKDWTTSSDWCGKDASIWVSQPDMAKPSWMWSGSKDMAMARNERSRSPWSTTHWSHTVPWVDHSPPRWEPRGSGMSSWASSSSGQWRSPPAAVYEPRLSPWERNERKYEEEQNQNLQRIQLELKKAQEQIAALTKKDNPPYDPAKWGKNKQQDDLAAKVDFLTHGGDFDTGYKRASFFVFGTAYAWGQQKWGPHKVDKSRTYIDVINDPQAMDSYMRPVLAEYSPDHIIDIDCSWLDHMPPDPFQDGKKHLGFHCFYINHLASQNNGKNLEMIFIEFMKKLMAKPMDILKDKDGLAILAWCHYGKHRSAAVIATIVWLVGNVEGWFEVGGPPPEVTLLSKDMWSGWACGRRTCENCSIDLVDRDGDGWDHIVDIWNAAKRKSWGVTEY